MSRVSLRILTMTALFLTGGAMVFGQNAGGCADLPSQETLLAALKTAATTETSGLNSNEWAVLVDRDGTVCAVAFSGSTRGSQLSAGRLLAAQKANTAAIFNMDAPSAPPGTPIDPNAPKVLSTANLYSALQPGGSLFGLQESSPVNTSAVFKGPTTLFGGAQDPLVGLQVGGVNAFGGGLALYANAGTLVGGLGVSGDTPCADHNVAWRIRNLLNLDHLAGFSAASGDLTHPDNIVFDIGDTTTGTTSTSATSKSGFGSPKCANIPTTSTLPAVRD